MNKNGILKVGDFVEHEGKWWDIQDVFAGDDNELYALIVDKDGSEKEVKLKELGEGRQAP